MMRVAPLFETREDLINAPKVIDAALTVQWYKDHVQVRGGLGGVPSGKRLHSELERSTISNGSIHYFNGHFQ